MSHKCKIDDPIDLTKVDPRQILLEFKFNSFWLTEEDEDEEFAEEGWLEGKGVGYMYLAEDPIDDDDIDNVNIYDTRRIAEFSFNMGPDGIKIRNIKNENPVFVGIVQIAKEYSEQNEVEFVGPEVEMLGNGRYLPEPFITTLSKRYVG